MQHPNHPAHDLTLIAGHAAGDLAASERIRAEVLLDTCGECADVHRDLIAIAAATRSLPNLATAPRDFRLAPEQAARLRRTSVLLTFLAPFGAARSASRPLAAAFTSLGIAGLLVATVLPGLLGSAASPTAGNERDQGAIAPAATAAPVILPGQPAAIVASANPDEAVGVKNGDGATAAPEFGVAGGAQTEAPRGPTDSSIDLKRDSPPNLLFIGSLALLAVGLLLFGLRFASRRLR
jgi:anti-sigma factor RsiW